MEPKITKEELERTRVFEEAHIGDRWRFERYGSTGTIISKSHFIIRVQLDNKKNKSFLTRYKIYFN